METTWGCVAAGCPAGIRTNPYAKLLKKPDTIRRDTTTVNYTKSRAEKSDIPYRALVGLYLCDCTKHQCFLEMRQGWGSLTRPYESAELPGDGS